MQFFTERNSNNSIKKSGDAGGGSFQIFVTAKCAHNSHAKPLKSLF